VSHSCEKSIDASSHRDARHVTFTGVRYIHTSRMYVLLIYIYIYIYTGNNTNSFLVIDLNVEMSRAYSLDGRTNAISRQPVDIIIDGAPLIGSNTIRGLRITIQQLLCILLLLHRSTHFTGTIHTRTHSHTLTHRYIYIYIYITSFSSYIISGNDDADARHKLQPLLVLLA